VLISCDVDSITEETIARKINSSIYSKVYAEPENVDLVNGGTATEGCKKQLVLILMIAIIDVMVAFVCRWFEYDPVLMKLEQEYKSVSKNRLSQSKVIKSILKGWASGKITSKQLELYEPKFVKYNNLVYIRVAKKVFYRNANIWIDWLLCYKIIHHLNDELRLLWRKKSVC